MVFVRRSFGRCIALALLGHHVHENGARVGVTDVLQHREQMLEVVAVDRPDIEEAELLEHRAAGPEAARKFLRALGLFVEELGQVLGELFHALADRPIRAAGHQPRQIGRHGACRRRNRHVVIVEDHDQALVTRAGIVHRLICHAGRHGAVADHADDVMFLALEIARHCHAEPGRNRGRGMRRAERIVFAFGALSETRQPAALAKRTNAVAPTGQDLVRIGLVTDVPDQLVGRRIEHGMQRHGKFDHA